MLRSKILIYFALISSLFAREYIAIIDFEGIGVTKDEARALTQRLTSEMIVLEEYQIVERSEMKRLLSEQKFQYSGCVDIACAVDIGKLIGAKYMVIGSVSKLGSAYSLDSRMISVETGEAYISGKYTAQGGIENLLEGMISIAYQLCEEDYVGVEDETIIVEDEIILTDYIDTPENKKFFPKDKPALFSLIVFLIMLTVNNSS